MITKLAVGGAQLNTLISTRDIDAMGCPSTILTGPERPPEGDLYRLADEWGLRVLTARHLTRNIAPVRDLLAFFEIRREITRGGYDVVHTHGSKARFLGRLAAATCHGVKIVQTAHGWPFYDSMNPFLQWLYVTLEKIGFGLAHANIAVSPMDRDKAMRHGIGRYDDYRIIRSGVELEGFRALRGSRSRSRRLLDIPEDREVVGSVMRFCPEKAPDLFVKVAERVLAERPGVLFLLVGDGPLWRQTRHLIRARGLKEDIVLLGSRDDVRDILPAFDLFLITSRTEGLPRALLETLAAGVPVVATDVGGIPELVGGGRNGILCPEGDVRCLTGGVLRLLAEPERRPALTVGADEDLEPFSARRMVEQLHELYDRMVYPPMHVVLLCDDEPFNIPQTVTRIIRNRPFLRYTLVSLAGHGSMRHTGTNIRRYMALYGPLGFVRKLAGYALRRAAAALRLPTRTPHSLRRAARLTGAGFERIERLNSKAGLERLRQLSPDVIISIACPQILKKRVLELPPLGAWNVHSAMLPRNRGMLPTFWALLKGDRPGVSLHRMTRRLDDGEILLQREVDADMETVSLEDLLSGTKELASELVVEGLDRIERGEVELLPNPAEEATSNTFPTREDVRVFLDRGGQISGTRHPRPKLALSFDVEEWFHTSAARRWFPPEQWDGIEPRVPVVMDSILELLERQRARATFFVLGWILERHPDLVRRISDCGHEIASHGYSHVEITQLSREQFESDLDRFRRLVDRLSIPPPRGFRAPSFSMVSETKWAVDAIVSNGYSYDSSVYPMFKHRYGMPDAPQEPFMLQGGRSSILELPLASISMMGVKVPVAGGAYMRFYPGILHRKFLADIAKTGRVPVIYLHPWEIDSVNMSSRMNMLQRFRQHHNSGRTMVRRLGRILRVYRTITLSELAEDVERGELQELSVL